MSALPYGDAAARKVSQRVAAPCATLTAVKAIGAKGRVDGMIVHNQADGSKWRFHGTSVLTGDDLLVATPADAPSAGRWLLMPGSVMLSMAITFATADAAILLTVPTGCRLQILEPSWKVDTSFTGGASSAIGLSSSNKASFTTKGDLLGGATGDVAAGLLSTGLAFKGTVGAGYDTLAKRRVTFDAADTVRFDRITSAFTAGAGSVKISCVVLQNDGA